MGEAMSELIPVDNEKDCGMGQGAECCIYLGMVGAGFVCLRESGLAPHREQQASFGLSVSRRRPTARIPHCQNVEPSSDLDLSQDTGQVS